MVPRPQPTQADSIPPSGDGPSLSRPANGSLGLQLGEELGRGGMGVVYRATDPEFDRPVAVKLILPEQVGRSEAVRRFLDEAKITGRLQHPGIPAVHRLGTLPDGRPFMTMKLIQGRTFAALLGERDDVQRDLGRHLHIFEQVCQTVAYAHEQGVIHRDLKPANVMVGAFGEVQLMDWGLAKYLGQAGDSTPPLPTDEPDTSVVSGTVPGNALGTPAYMPPEQARGEHVRVDARADVFALGAMLCEILTGRPPFQGQFALLAARAGDLTDAQKLLDACGADADLIALTRRCLASDPAERPADASVVVQAMTAYQVGVEQRLRAAERERTAAAARSAEERKRRRVQRVLLGAVLLLVCGGGGFAWYVDRQASARRNEAAVRGGIALEAIRANLVTATTALRDDKPDEATLAVQEARRRLHDEPSADAPGELTRQLEDTQRQLSLLVELERSLDRFWGRSEGKFFDSTRASQEFAQAFQDHALDLSQPAQVQEQLADWAIRPQVLGLLDQWLSIDPGQAQLPPLLAVLDPDASRTAWRAALASKNYELQLRTSLRLATAEQSARFVAAYGTNWPPDPGLRLLRSALDRAPTSFALAFALAQVLARGDAGHVEEAVGFYRVCRSLRPDQAAPALNLGRLLFRRGDLDGAFVNYSQALAIDPAFADAHVGFGNVLRAWGDIERAVECYCAAIAFEPRHAHAHNNLGMYLQAQNDLEGAIAYYRVALESNPVDTRIHYNLGTALEDKKDLDGAIAAYQNALSVSSQNSQAQFSLANALYNRNDVGGAIAVYRNLVAINPNHALAQYNLAIALKDTNDDAGAIECYRKVIALAPHYAAAHNNLGRILQSRNDLPGAIACYRQAIANVPNHAPALCNLGIALAVTNDVAGAVASFRKALARSPDFADAHHHLGLSLRQQGYFAEAVAALRRGDELGRKRPDWVPAERLLAETERLAQLDDRLPRVLEGAEEPATAREAVEFAELCFRYRQRYADAVWFYGEGFRLDPALAAHPHAYSAACAAVRAGQRQQALRWLRADLAGWSKLRLGSAPLRRQFADHLAHCLKDTDLAPVREPAALVKLPPEERQTWHQFWDDVHRTLEESAKPRQ